MSRRLISGFYLLVMTLLLFACTKKPTPSDIIVTFPDPNLEAVVRDVLKNHSDDIYASQLSGIYGLTAYHLMISDISGLEYCINLKELNLSKNKISEIAPLAPLARLERLYMAENKFCDISPLVRLTNLETLELQYNKINDIRSLAALKNLVILILHHNEISDIYPLVENSENGGLDSGNAVWLEDNPLSEQSINEYIPVLRARGVTVHY